MSGHGPESIPTSADPRSHRPTKRRALDTRAQQAASVDALFARPDQHIHVPASTSSSLVSSSRQGHAPPEIVANVQGSSAGAGSGEFHVYKAARRREYERLKGMDDEVRRERETKAFEEGKAERERRDEERTRKNREKREKMKARKAKKGKGNNGNTSSKSGDSGDGDTHGGEHKAGWSANDHDVQTDEGLKPGENKRKQQHSRDASEQPDGSEAPAASSSTPAVGLIIHDDD